MMKCFKCQKTSISELELLCTDCQKSQPGKKPSQRDISIFIAMKSTGYGEVKELATKHSITEKRLYQIRDTVQKYINGQTPKRKETRTANISPFFITNKAFLELETFKGLGLSHPSLVREGLDYLATLSDAEVKTLAINYWNENEKGETFPRKVSKVRITATQKEAFNRIKRASEMLPSQIARFILSKGMKQSKG